MFVLLAGVWAVSAQASVDESDIAAEFDIEDQAVSDSGCVTPEINPHTHGPSYASTAVHHRGRTVSLTPGITAPPMNRQVRSEGAVFPESSLSLHTLQHSSPSAPHQTDVSPLSPNTSFSSRHRPTVVDLSASMHSIASSLHQHQSSSVMTPAGLTIGLSPVSPGFGPFSSPRRTSRRVSGLGHGFAAVVNESMSLAGSVSGRRRTVSVGQERHFEEARDRGEWSSPHAELLQEEMGAGHCTTGGNSEGDRTGGRWRWLRNVFLRRNSRPT